MNNLIPYPIPFYSPIPQNYNNYNKEINEKIFKLEEKVQELEKRINNIENNKKIEFIKKEDPTDMYML